MLQLIAEGLSNQRIADELVISVKTVEAHKAHIMSKLHARNRTDLIRYAIKRGLVGLESRISSRSSCAPGSRARDPAPAGSPAARDRCGVQASP